MTALAAYTTQWGTHPYLQPAEYLHAPTSVDVSQLDPGGSNADQLTELRNNIRRASAWVDNYCGQAMWATLDIENVRVRSDRRGRLRLHPKFSPILEVRDIQYGGSPALMSGLADFSNLWIENQALIVDTMASTSFSGSLNYQSPRPGGELYVRYAYVNGWPDTTITANLAAGATSITVTDATGIYGGATTPTATAILPPATQLTIYDDAFTETVSVASVAGNVLTLNAGTQFAHVASPTAPLPITAMPSAIRQASILATSAMIKTRGFEAIAMGSIEGGGGRIVAMDGVQSSDLFEARDLLRPYRRVR